MRVVLPILLALLAAAPGAARGAPSRPAAEEVTHVRVEGQLDVGVQALIRRAIDAAAARGGRLVVELDTPGGEVQRMWRIARMLDAAAKDGVHTVAWVHDHALSAGALVALACESLLVAPTASIGSAQPIAIGPTGIQGLSPDEVVEEKTSSTLRSSFRAWAEAHGRPAALAEAMVDPDVWVRQVRVGGTLRLVTDDEWRDLQVRGQDVELVRTISPPGQLLNLTGREAVELDIADAMAESLEEVIAKTGGPAPVTTVVPQRSEELASALSRIAPLLLVLGILLAYVEFKVPGFGVPGILSIACFGLLLFGRYLTGLADVPHIVLVAVGIVLLAVEILVVPGTVWVGVVGGLAVLAGLAWSSVGSGLDLAYPLDRQIALDASFRLVLSAFGALVGVWLLSRVLPETRALGWLVLRPRDESPLTGRALAEVEGPHARLARPGARGRALTPLRPVGKVSLDDDPSVEFEARSSGPGVAAGSPVRVVEVRAGRLVVEESLRSSAP